MRRTVGMARQGEKMKKIVFMVLIAVALASSPADAQSRGTSFGKLCAAAPYVNSDGSQLAAHKTEIYLLRHGIARGRAVPQTDTNKIKDYNWLLESDGIDEETHPSGYGYYFYNE